MYVIYQRNGTTKSDPLYRKLVPFYEPILLFLFSIPYAATAYVVRFELVEYSAGLIFIHCALLGALYSDRTDSGKHAVRGSVPAVYGGDADSFIKRGDDCSIGKRGGDYAGLCWKP